MRALLALPALLLLALPGTAAAATARAQTTCLPPVKGMGQGCLVAVGAGDDMLTLTSDRVAAGLRYACGAGAGRVETTRHTRIGAGCEEMLFGDAAYPAQAPVATAAARCAFSDVHGFPAVHGGQVYGLSCRTARAIANRIQAGVARTGRQPARLRANGMRFRCRYRFYTEGDGQLQRATCRRTSRPAHRAVLKLSA